jgi:hypothetical protein
MNPRSAPVYPNVRCSYGHPEAPGYAVCKHIVVDHAPVASVAPANRSRLGSVCCNRAAKDHRASDLVLVCGQCASRRGYLTVAQEVLQ